MSSDDGPGPELSRRLGYLFKHAAARLEELHTQALAPFDVDARELGVLLVLSGHEPASQQQVAQRLGVDRTTMVALIDRLEDKGLVFRRPHAEDRRRNVIDLTDHGKDTLRRATRASDDAERALLAPLTSQDRKRLRDTLQLIVAQGNSDKTDRH
ncbi:MarR family winged helix-turn-helix transcriptional regulator [Plantactinospora sp. BB1]|uniref:MarR family winged helix-turn-helix transcriptional regulator n=1 Tax=Plantactinospora sp. BB1 TaxID=2071627 RepID=UPI000D162C6B|nr:MarR family transcriptional regulator [Plantactinospora sp. BB1]AVT41507.1 MarR family transcriptional regulator [Plantactinospora sp. BB1]